MAWRETVALRHVFEHVTRVTHLGPDHGGHQLARVHVDDGEGERDVELADHGEADSPPGVLA